MKFLEQYSIKNSFKVDCKGKGKFAEDIFIDYFNSNEKNHNKSLFDVRNTKDYQNKDIDFVIDNEGELVLPSVEEVLSNKERYIKIEVKYSGPALKTGNFAFEVISHSRRGWGIKTECDYIFVVFIKDNKVNEYEIGKLGIIDFKKWMDFIDDKSNYTKVTVNKDENYVVDILTKLDEMEKKGVLQYC